MTKRGRRAQDFENYKLARTIQDYFARGATTADYWWDISKGILRFDDPSLQRQAVAKVNSMKTFNTKATGHRGARRRMGMFGAFLSMVTAMPESLFGMSYAHMAIGAYTLGHRHHVPGTTLLDTDEMADTYERMLLAPSRRTSSSSSSESSWACSTLSLIHI